MRFSKQLKSWREREKLSQPEAAEKLGVSVRTLQNWEQEHNCKDGPKSYAKAALIARMTPQTA